MTRDELHRHVLRIYRTLDEPSALALALVDALGIPRTAHGTHARAHGRTHDWSRKARRYHGARKLMKQKHGVRL